MEAQENKSLAEQGRQYVEQLQEEGKAYQKKEQEVAENILRKLFEKNEDDLNDPNNCAAC